MNPYIVDQDIVTLLNRVYIFCSVIITSIRLDPPLYMEVNQKKGCITIRYDPFKHHRHSIRLEEYDYSRIGHYFITINLENREKFFGSIIDGRVELSEIGKIARKNWLEIPNHYPNTEIDAFVIMPDHMHGILIICQRSEGLGGVQNFEPLLQVDYPGYIETSYPVHHVNQYQHIIPKSIGSIVRAYKASVTQWCRMNGFSNFQWQRNFYEHVIRNDSELSRVRDYIIDNPLNSKT